MINNIPKICIIGAGSLSTRRIYPYIATAGAVLAGVCDLDIEKAEKNSLLFGGKAYTDIDKMLDEQQPDGVIICVGPNAHPHLALKVIERGIPVYTEKPPAPTSELALKVARAAEEKNVLCMTAFKKRYTNSTKRAKEWLSSKENLYSISVDYASAQYDNSEGHNFLLDFGIHLIDLCQYLMGDVEQVFAFSKDRDAYAVSLKFKNGAVGSLNLNDGRSFDIPTEEIEITAKGGNFMTIHNSSSWKITDNGQCTQWREPPTFVSGGDSGFDTGHLPELMFFVDAVKNGIKTAPSNIYESYKTMVLYEAIKESSETSRIVDVRFL